MCSGETSKIILTIDVNGEQPILNGSFYSEPIHVYVNNQLYDSCKKSCNLPSDSTNIVTLEFSNEINSFENMFAYLSNIKSIDLSLFDASKVTNMQSMFEHCTN